MEVTFCEGVSAVRFAPWIGLLTLHEAFSALIELVLAPKSLWFSYPTQITSLATPFSYRPFRPRLRTAPLRASIGYSSGTLCYHSLKIEQAKSSVYTDVIHFNYVMKCI